MKWLPLIIFVILVSCQSGNKKKHAEPEPEPKVRSGCYQMIIGRDTAYIEVNVSGDSAKGILVFNPLEKDKNTGTYSGVIKDDTLDIWYNFLSEGRESYRQIRMVATTEGLIQGYGDMRMEGDSVFFKYPQALAFERINPFKKINCANR